MTAALDPGRRRLEPGWRERHIQGQADGSMAPGKIPLTYEDGTAVLDRLGRPRMWSHYVEAATRTHPNAAARARKRELERQAARAADAARLADAVRKVRSEARLGLLPPPGRLAAVDMDALLLIGPLGAVGCGAVLLRTLAILTGKGRHPVEVLVAAGHWRDEAALGAALDGFRPRLAAIGLRLCRRRNGWRLTKSLI